MKLTVIINGSLETWFMARLAKRRLEVPEFNRSDLVRELIMKGLRGELLKTPQSKKP